MYFKHNCYITSQKLKLKHFIDIRMYNIKLKHDLYNINTV